MLNKFIQHIAVKLSCVQYPERNKTEKTVMKITTGQSKVFPRFTAAMLLLFCIVFSHEGLAFAGTSTNYRIDDSYFGPGGVLDSGSTNYQFQSGQQSVGNTGVTEGASTNYQSQGGFTTTNDPRLSCVINTSSINFGSLSTSVASTATATFSVLNYTSYGYVVSIIGSPPSSGSHTLANMSSTVASSAGTEQFGINLVANTSPTTFGANPVQVPDSTFSFGAAASNYNTTNNFRYNSGETIAQATKTSGQTNYTISYIVNAATTTPGGSYSGNQALVCTGTY
jgi:hypothetical protein